VGEGQDWASYQGGYPSAAGLDFVGVKVTEGVTYANPFWRKQLAIVRAAGAVPLLYHYPHFGNGVAAEVKHFRDTISGDLQPGDVLVLDWEGYDSANAGIPMARQIAYKDAFLTALAAAEPAHQVGTYANVDYLDHDPHGHYGDFLWIATAGRAEGQPGIAHPWLFHQYSERGGLDRDYTPMTRAELTSWAHEKGDPMPTAQEIAQAVWDHVETNAETGKPVRFGAVMAWSDREHGDIMRKEAAITAQLGALSAAVTALAQKGGISADQVQAAAKAGAAAALAELGVDLEHLQPAPAPAPAPVQPHAAATADGVTATPSVDEEAAETAAQEAAEQPEPAGA
jgi:hypothetical protein